jgi:hypothetical protein
MSIAVPEATPALSIGASLGIPPLSVDGPFRSPRRLTPTPAQDMLLIIILSAAVLEDLLLDEIMALGAKGHTIMGAEAVQTALTIRPLRPAPSAET